MIVNVTAQLNATATGSTASFCEIKYGKSKAITFVVDDDPDSAMLAFNKLKNTYYTNGAGSNIPLSMGLAVNGCNVFTNNEFGKIGAPYATYAQQREVIDHGGDVENHTFYHDHDQQYNNLGKVKKNISDLTDLLISRINYRTNALTVPQNYADNMKYAAELGMVAGQSTGTFDDFIPTPRYLPVGNVADIPKGDYNAYQRAFSDVWTNSGIQWELANRLITENFNFFCIGTHGFAVSGQIENFIAWIDWIVANYHDDYVFTSLREFAEYQHIRQHVTKTETITGNTLKIKLDYSTVPNRYLSWFDTSMKLNTSATITGVTIDDSSFSTSFNPTTKLININKRKTIWTADPTPNQLLVKHGRFII